MAVKINQRMIEGLVDTGASMSIMATNVVRKHGIMHLVASHETYKTTFGIMTQALGRITKLPIKVGRIICEMILWLTQITMICSLDWIFSSKLEQLLMWRRVSYMFAMDPEWKCKYCH